MCIDQGSVILALFTINFYSVGIFKQILFPIHVKKYLIIECEKSSNDTVIFGERFLIPINFRNQCIIRKLQIAFPIIEDG